MGHSVFLAKCFHLNLNTGNNSVKSTMYKSQQNKMRVIKDKKRQKIYLDLKLNKQKHRSNQMHV